MSKVLALFERIQKFVEAVLGIALAIMMTVVFAQTFTRYVVFHSIPWSEELSRFLFVGIIVLDGHLGKRSAKVAEILRQLIGLVMNAAFAYSTIDLIEIGQMQKSPSMQIPMSVMYSILLIGFVLACLSILVKIVSLLKDGKECA